MAEVEITKLNTLTGHNDCIYTVARLDDSHFLSGAGDGMLVLWDQKDPENGRLIAKVPTSIYAVAYHPSSKLVLVGQNFEGLHFIDITSKKEMKSLQLGNTAIFDIKLLDNRAIVGLGDGSVKAVDIQDNRVTTNITAGKESARSIAVSSANKEFAVGYSDNRIRIFDLVTYSLKKEIEAHTNSVFTVAYSPDERWLLSGSRDAHLKVWDRANDYALSRSIVAHMYAINHIDFSPNGKHFVTCSMDKSIKVWDVENFRLLKVIDKARHAGHGTSVNKLYWSNFENQLVSCSDDRTISVWDLNFNRHV